MSTTRYWWQELHGKKNKKKKNTKRPRMTLADFGPWGPPKRRATLYGPSQSRHILTDRHYNVSLTSHSPLLIRQRTTKATQQIRVGPWRLFQTDTASKAPTNIWQRHSTTLYNSQSLFSSFFIFISIILSTHLFYFFFHFVPHRHQTARSTGKRPLNRRQLDFQSTTWVVLFFLATHSNI